MGPRRAALQPWLYILFGLMLAAAGTARAFGETLLRQRVLSALLALAGLAMAVSVVRWMRLRRRYNELQRAQLASLEAVNPGLASRLQSDGSLLLYGTIGSAASLLPDGRVWMEFEDERPGSNAIISREATPEERIVALVLGARRMPQLRQHLPIRPASAPDCDRCGGTGDWRSVICLSCMGLGWVDASTLTQLGNRSLRQID
jgi:hypothetical protein